MKLELTVGIQDFDLCIMAEKTYFWSCLSIKQCAMISGLSDLLTCREIKINKIYVMVKI